MSSSSRRIRSLEDRQRVKIFRAVVITFLFVGLLFFLGPRFLVKFSLILDRLRNPIEQKVSQESTFLLPPSFDFLPRVTKEEKISISGSARPGSEVVVFLNDVSKGVTLANQDGSFSLKDVYLSQGENKITALARSEGMESNLNEAIIVILKDEKPKLEISDPQDKQKFNSDKRIYIRGLADPENELTINDRVAIVSPSGAFNHVLELAEGENKITATAKDEAGNESTIELVVFFSR